MAQRHIRRRVPAPGETPRRGPVAPPAPPTGFLSALAVVLPPVAELWHHRLAFAWCLLAAVLWRLCYAPLGWWPLAFVALVPWLWSLRRTTTRGAFWLSWFFGFVFFMLMFFWLGSLARFNPFIWLGIPGVAAFQGLFVAFAGAGIVHAARRVPPSVAFVFAALWWAGLEWWRSVGPMGDPFALLSQGVGGFDPLIQVVSLGGLFLVSALVFAVNLTIMETIASIRLRIVDPGTIIRGAASIALVVWACIWGGGVITRAESIAEDGIPVRVALLQTNIDQELKFESYMVEDSSLRDMITLNLLGMIDSLEPGTVDLVVTPESAFTVYDFDRNTDLQRELRERADRLGATLIVGANDLIFKREDGSLTEVITEARLIDEQFYDYGEYNGLFVFRPGETELKTRADFQKVHLMPFGETVPYFWIIPGLQEHIVQVGNLMRGDIQQPPIFFPIPKDRADPHTEFYQIQIGPSICFEDMFAYLHRRWNRRGAQLHVNITNNGWFEPSIGAQLHHDFARFRAPETQTPMIYATNTGVSAVVDASGRLIESLPRLEKDILITTVHVPREPSVTWYARLGDLIGWIGFWGGVLALIGMFFLKLEEE